VQHYKVVTSDTFNSYILNMQMNNLPEGTEIYNDAFSETIINNTRINDRSFNIVIPKENITLNIQAGTERTIYAVWKWTVDHTENYEVKWY